MPLASAYYRPDSLDEAIRLLEGDNRVALAGGTIVNADREHSDIELVDLQSLDLSAVTVDGHSVSFGAMTTLATVADDDDLPAEMRLVARAEMPSTLRTRATVGGTMAVMHPDSVLAAALLAADGSATFADGSTTSLADVFASGLAPGALIVSVNAGVSGTMTVAKTGRTPADVPIVAAVAYAPAPAQVPANGDTVTVALTGVAATPVLVDANDPTRGLKPPNDFRGSSGYRLHLAATLTRRVVEDVR